MAKIKTAYICSNCGYESAKWLGKCPDCESFGSFIEEIVERTSSKVKKTTVRDSQASRLKEVDSLVNERIKTGINELDRVLSGGFVPASITLIAGNPGIGKSTLILQICEYLGESSNKILYVSGEESKSQIKMRADRLGVKTDNLYLLSETNLDIVEAHTDDIKPEFLIIDSIQTTYIDELKSAPGSITQVRECTSRLMRVSKKEGVTVIIVSHVTKDGSIAGPKILEHMVDTVLQFEGDEFLAYRMLRAVKNRFGSTNEIGVFEMEKEGLIEIKNPSQYMLSGRAINVSGSVITASLEGSRAVLAEVQALASKTSFGMPRRNASGMDYNRMVLQIAVLEKHLNYKLADYDIYANITAGLKVLEPALDAALILAIASTYRNKNIDPYTIVFGEVGLNGEIRAVSQSEKRIQEAERMGFKTCIIPKVNYKKSGNTYNLKVHTVSNIRELIDILIY